MVGLAGTQSLTAAETVLKLGDVKITVIPPPLGLSSTEQNLNSIGLLVEYAGFRALMTGDSEPQETNAWLRRYGGRFSGPIDVYKAIHHASTNRETRSWLAAVRPKNVVVSVGPNDYGHPAPSTLALYRTAGAAVYRTDQQGTVTVTVQADGRYAITTERPSSPPPTPGGLIKSPVPVVPPPARDVSYPNCAAVRAAGKSPLLRGQPGYRAGLDRDGDGRACE